MMRFLLISTLTALVSMTGWSDPTSWGDQNAVGNRDSVNTRPDHPGRYATDTELSSYWQLNEGATEGWSEYYAATPVSNTAINLTADLPVGATLQIEMLENNHWVVYPGLRLTGPSMGTRTLETGMVLPRTDHILVRLLGPNAAMAKVYNVATERLSLPPPLVKISPLKYTINTKEYINLKASRLWDGIGRNAWYEPLWSLPYEVFQTDVSNQPKDIFPPYMGHPQGTAEIVWSLDGTYNIKSLKANFLAGSPSVQFEFRDGQRWVAATTIGNRPGDSGPGWKRIELSSPIATDQIRITFPGGWERARFVGELEVWGEGWPQKLSQSLVSSNPLPSGQVQYTISGPLPNLPGIEITKNGLSNLVLKGSFNGNPFELSPATWNNGQTVYRLEPNDDWIRPTEQFVNIDGTNGEISVRSYSYDTSNINLGWPYSDGQLTATQTYDGSPAPTTKLKLWELDREYSVESVRIYTNSSSAPMFKTASVDNRGQVIWQTIPLVSLGHGIFGANTQGRIVSKAQIEAASQIRLDEVVLAGTPLSEKKVGMEVWWPKPGKVTSNGTDGNSIIGWMGDPSVQPMVGAFHPRQADRLFWIPLSQMGTSFEESSRIRVLGQMGAAVGSRSLSLSYTKRSQATFDQGEEFQATSDQTYLISGTVKDGRSRVFVDEQEVPVLGGKFSYSKSLAPGFQRIGIVVKDKNLKQIVAGWEKEVYRANGDPRLTFDLPPGSTLSKKGFSLLSGRIGNGSGLRLTMDGKPLTLEKDQFVVPVIPTEGDQAHKFVLTGDQGTQSVFNLAWVQDSTPPSFQITRPLQNQYLASSLVEIRTMVSFDPGLWWKIDNESWEWDPGQGHVKSYSLRDGFYNFQIWAQDSAGNLSGPQAIPFVVDTVAPLPFSITADVTGWTPNTTPELTFSTSDVTSGVHHYEMSVDGSEWLVTQSPHKLATLSDGVHQIFIKAIDNAGNSTLATIELSIDAAKPTGLVFESNTIGWSSNTTPTLSFHADDSTSGVQTYDLSLDNGSWLAVSAPYVLQALSDGKHLATVRATDRAGNSVETSMELHIDATPPEAFELTSNIEGWSNNDRPTLTFDTTDLTSGLAGFERRIDTGPWVSVLSPDQVPILTDGIHQLSIQAIDLAGNITSRSIEVRIDTTPPVAVRQLRIVPGNDELVGQWVTDDIDLTKYHVVWTQKGTDSAFDQLGTEYRVTNVEVGTTTNIRVQPVDRAGNLGPWTEATGAIVGMAIQSYDASSPNATVVEYQNLKLAIPAGSLPAEVKAIMVNEVESPSLVEKSDFPLVSPIYSFSTLQQLPNGDLEEASHTEFSKDIMVVLDYDESLIPNGFPESNLGVYYFDTLWSRWFRTENAFVDIEHNKIVFLTNHFTNFSVQPTMVEDLKPQELKDAGHSPFKGESQSGAVTVSPQGGTMMTEATEFVLKGKNGFQYPIKRIYDSQTARADSPSLNLSASLRLNFSASLPAEIVSQLVSAGVEATSSTLLAKVRSLFQKNGDFPLALGVGWRLNFPYVRASDTSVLVRTPSGSYYPINQMTLQGDAPVVSGARTLTFENHRSEDFTFRVMQVRADLVSTLTSGSTSGFGGLSDAIKGLLEHQKKPGAPSVLGSIGLIAGLVPSWVTLGSELTTKDGTSYLFDALGRVVTISDPSGSNIISFEYRGFVLDTITDPMGNVVTLTYDDGDGSGFFLRPSITHITAAGPQATTRSTSYEYANDDGMGVAFLTMPPLVKAIDVGGRPTTYEIDKRFLFSGGGSAKINFLAALINIIDPSGLSNNILGLPTLTLTGHINLEWPRLISKVTAPGQGTTRIEYVNKDLGSFDARPADYLFGIEWLPTALKLSYEFLYRIMTDKVVVENGSLSRTTAYDYRFTTRGSQFIVNWSQVNDGLTKTTEDYSIHQRSFRRYVSFDDALLAALKEGIFTEESNTEVEYFPLSRSTEVASVQGRFFEKVEKEWDEAHQRITKETTTRSDSFVRTVARGYDNWGNETSVVTTMKTPQGTSSSSVESQYYGTNSQLTGVPSGLPGSPSQVVAGTKDLVVSRLTKTSLPAGTGTQTLQNVWQGFAYDAFARPIWSGTYSKDHWAASTTEYYPAQSSGKLKGMVKAVVSAVGQRTEFGYDFTSLASQSLWTKKTTHIAVADPLGKANNIVTETAFDLATGWPRLEKSAEGDVTETRFDNLGRPVSVIRPGDEAPLGVGSWSISRVHAPWDRIVYDDQSRTSRLYKEVANGTELYPQANQPSERYSYDELGNLTTIEKFERSLNPPKVSVTTANYDPYSRVVSMTDPNGNSTVYQYDFRSRVKKTEYADGHFDSNTYDDALGQIVFQDVGGTKTDTRQGWLGQAEIQTQDVDGLRLVTTRRHDGAGRVVWEEDPLGQITVTSYSEWGTPSQITKPSVNVVTVPVGLPVTLPNLVSESKEPQVVFEYDDAGRKTLVKEGVPGTWHTNSLGLDGLGRVVRQNQDGRETLTWYDGTGRAIRLADPDKAATLTSSNLTLVDDGFTITRYTSRGQVKTVKDPSGAVTMYGYDRDDRKLWMRDPRGIGADEARFTIGYGYDDLGRLVSADLPPVPGQPRGTIQFRYDRRGNVLSQVAADGQITTWTYDARNRKTSELVEGTDGKTKTRAWAYDASGRVIKDIVASSLNQTHPEDSPGQATEHDYDALGREVETRTPNGQLTHLTLDALGRILKKKDASGAEVSFEYNSFNLVTKQTEPLGKVTQTEYDLWGKPAQTVQKESVSGDRVTVRGWNAHGEMAWERNNAGQSWTYGYNGRGLLESTLDPSGTTIANGYSPSGLLQNRTWTRGAESQSVTYQYDLAGALMGASDGEVATLFNRSGTTFVANPYDLVVSRKTTVLGQSTVIGYGYDIAQRVTSVVYPDTVNLTYSYNGLGQLFSAGTYATGGTWDAWGHLTALTAENGTGRTKTWNPTTGELDAYQWSGTSVGKRTLAWDNRGNLTRVQKDEGINGYDYDPLNRLTKATETGLVEFSTRELGTSTAAALSLDVGGQHRLNASEGTLVKPFDSAASSIGVDFGTITTINKIKLHAASDRLIQRTVEVYTSNTGLDGSWTKQPHALLLADRESTTVQFKQKISARFLKVHSTWDERDLENEPVDNALVRGKASDLLEVWSVTEGQATLWTYDSLGNRLSQALERNSATVTTTSVYYANSNRLKSNNGWQYNYDANGNLVERGTSGTWDTSVQKFRWSSSQGELWRYDYDLANRLIGVSHGTTGSASLVELVTYLYDYRNLRVASTRNGVTTTYAYDETGDLVWSREGTSTIKYVQVLGQPWAEVRQDGVSTAVYYHHTDHEGTTEAITDSNGTLVWQASYSAFGQLLRSNGVLAFTPSYTGKQLDADTGLYYYNARWYEPTLGRFISTDPIRSGDNWEIYVLSNPLRYVDPRGLEGIDWMGFFGKTLTENVKESMNPGAGSPRTVELTKSAMEAAKPVTDFALAANDFVGLAAPVVDIATPDRIRAGINGTVKDILDVKRAGIGIKLSVEVATSLNRQGKLQEVAITKLDIKSKWTGLASLGLRFSMDLQTLSPLKLNGALDFGNEKGKGNLRAGIFDFQQNQWTLGQVSIGATLGDRERVTVRKDVLGKQAGDE